MHTGLFMELKFHCYARAGPHGAFIPRPSAHPSVRVWWGGVRGLNLFAAKRACLHGCAISVCLLKT